MKSKRRKALVCGLLAGILLSACGTCKNENDSYEIPEEQKLVVYTSHKKEVYEPIVKEFEQRTGIYVDVKEGDTITLMNEIADNKNSGCDVMFGGGVENYCAYQDCFSTYEVKEKQLLKSECLQDFDKWTPFSQLPIVFVYNRKLVYTAAAPRTWEEMQSEHWKGQIAFANPESSGSSYTALCTMLQVLPGDTESVMENFVHALDKNVSAGSEAVVQEVNDGTKLVGITLEETARKKINAGADLEMVYPVDGTSVVPDGTAIVKDAPHRRNAERFLDFTVSEDVQRFMTENFFRRTVRSDMEDVDVTNLEDIAVIDYDIIWAAQEKDSILAEWEWLQREQDE